MWNIIDWLKGKLERKEPVEKVSGIAKWLGKCSWEKGPGDGAKEFPSIKKERERVCVRERERKREREREWTSRHYRKI